jgi:hypothetical protein
MKKQADLIWDRAALIGALLLILLLAAALPASAREKQIEIRGRMLVDDTIMSDALLVVEVDDQRCLPFQLDGDGRFMLRLPVGSKIQLRFEKPGYLTKEVLIDTKNALNTKRAAKLNKLVRFDVQMSRELPDRVYAGPVGTITFLKGSGLMKVKYDRTLAESRPSTTPGREL